jgi:hypothetical protein
MNRGDDQAMCRGKRRRGGTLTVSLCVKIMCGRCIGEAVDNLDLDYNRVKISLFLGKRDSPRLVDAQDKSIEGLYTLDSFDLVLTEKSVSHLFQRLPIAKTRNHRSRERDRFRSTTAQQALS